VRPARSGHFGSEHRGVTERGVIVALVRCEPLAVSRARPGELGERGGRACGQRPRDELLAREFSHGETFF
jgi:hypothetical protein